MVAQVYPLYRAAPKSPANDSESTAEVIERCLVYISEEARGAGLDEVAHMIDVAALAARTAGGKREA